MAVVEKRVLALVFGYQADADVKTTINVTNPKSGLQDSEIKAVMEAVVAASGLGNAKQENAVDKITEANYIDTETEELAL